ncbi:hypothetical protein EMIT0373P_30822 [Pseudomonas chlororaphis]
MTFFFKIHFNFNIEISVSWDTFHYQSPAGFRPRIPENPSGSPPVFSAPITTNQCTSLTATGIVFLSLPLLRI